MPRESRNRLLVGQVIITEDDGLTRVYCGDNDFVKMAFGRFNRGKPKEVVLSLEDGSGDFAVCLVIRQVDFNGHFRWVVYGIDLDHGEEKPRRQVVIPNRRKFKRWLSEKDEE